MEKQAMPIAIRNGLEGDVPFIFNSWLNSFRKGSFTRFVDNKIYFTEQHKLIERLLKRCEVKMACDPNDPSSICGYMVYERVEGILCVHYAYTKQTFRGMGICRQLLKNIDHDFNNAAICTHNTITGTRIGLKYNLIYHPYILINYKVEK
jgi:hypothetical protein